MKLNNKGFAISSIIYISLSLFLILIMALLAMMGSRKAILDKIRKEVYNDINGIVGSGSDPDQPLDIAFPTMTDNMIPIVYSPTGISLKADTKDNKNNNWYNYNQGKWANVVLVKENGVKTREYYKSAAPGTIISANDILAYFVWIPRYSYAVDSINKEIKINFENKTVPKKTGTGIGADYYTHPAFEIAGGIKLNGIWIGKFATSGVPASNVDDIATEITILPGKEALIMLSAKEMLINARKIELSNNIYGFSTTGTVLNDDGLITGDINQIKAQVLKSIEYGALALLSQSKYGINGKINPYDESGTPYTGGGTGIEYLTDLNRSSTGNIYGVYDMVSSIGELVMGHYFTVSGIRTVFYDMYNDDNSYVIKGDATSADDLGPWQAPELGVYQQIAYNQYYLRGKGSVFSYIGTSGETNSAVGFRVSLAIWE